MTILRVVKRDASAVNAALDFNPSVFRYYVDTIETKKEVVKNGLKSAFCGMLDELIRPDENNIDIDGNWTFSNPVVSNNGIGGTTTITNTYDGIKYIYRDAVSTIQRELIPAKLNGFTGRTFSGVYNMMMNRWDYTQTTDLNEIAYAEFLDPGYPPEIVDIEVVGGEPRIPAIYNVTPSGYYPVQAGETGTHGKEGFGYRPLAYWNEVTVSPGTEEFHGRLTENQSGFMLETSKIMFCTTATGEALDRYNPIDLITFAELIKLQYQYRLNATAQGEM